MKTENLSEQERQELDQWMWNIIKNFPGVMYSFDYRTEILTLYLENELHIKYIKQPLKK